MLGVGVVLTLILFVTSCLMQRITGNLEEGGALKSQLKNNSSTRISVKRKYASFLPTGSSWA